MIIDCHIHVKGGDEFRTENTAEEIIPVLDISGIDKAVVFAMCTDPVTALQMVYKEVCKFPNRLIGFSYARPMYDRSVKEVLREGFEKYDMRGIKIHKGETIIHPDVAGPVYEIAIEYDYPCIMDTGNDLNAAYAVIKKYPELKLILAHHGVPGGSVTAINSVIDFVKDYPNVYLDTAYMPTYWKIRDAVNKLGSERIIFGSDGILLDPRTELKKIEVLGFNDEQLENIRCNNIRKLIKI
ncbi:MAG: amidohydrolase family protein [Oscillospiraceae bacterium]|nr:amidohydrolase family protein [Oscillospiraceae bacterium]